MRWVILLALSGCAASVDAVPSEQLSYDPLPLQPGNCGTPDTAKPCKHRAVRVRTLKGVVTVQAEPDGNNGSIYYARLPQP